MKDPDAKHDCCYYDIPFREPIEIWAYGEPTIVFATAVSPGITFAPSTSFRRKISSFEVHASMKQHTWHALPSAFAFASSESLVKGGT